MNLITWHEGDPCELCGEPEDADDVIGHFTRRTPVGTALVMAHYECGTDAGYAPA
jgi:hypothetical protein